MREFAIDQVHLDGIDRKVEKPGIVSSRKDIVGWLTTTLLCLIILMSGAAIGIQVADLQNQGQRATLSLGEVPPPSDAPLFMVQSAPEARYLRGAVGIIYDGKDWQLQKAKGEGLDLDIRSNEGTLPLQPTAQGQTYASFDRDVLNSAMIINDGQYLSLPDNVSDRVKELSMEITQGYETPYEKARAIEVFLKLNYSYELGFSPAPSNWEPNDWFLFESKEGICGNFSSAFVILARASDIPSRLAAGYFVKSGEGEQVVYERQAHAWAEVGFEELGWITFDAT
ncbi:transglutaminase family protein [Chloroflexota bacterium]